MATNKNIGQLDQAQDLSGEELVPIFQDGHTKKLSLNDLVALGGLSDEDAAKLGGILNLGHVANLDAACNAAKASAVCNSRDIWLIKFTYQGAAGKVGSFILQSVKGDNMAMQLLFDKCHIKMRNITGTSGASPNAYDWAEIEGQNLHYDAANRKIILKSYYEDAEVASVTIPLATAEMAGLMSAEDKTAIASIPTAQTENNGTTSNYIYHNYGNNNLCVVTRHDTGFVWNNNNLQFRLGFYNPTGQSGMYGSVNMSGFAATASRLGFMPAASFAKLNDLPDNATLSATYAKKTDLPDMTALSSSIGARDNIYSYDETNPNGKRAVQGSLLFALTAESTEAEIKAALTEFSTKNVLTYADLNYAATHGAMLYDQNTQAYVQVTHNGGGFFNFLELSTAGWNELPKLRYVSIRITEDGTTWQVKRAGNSDRLVTLTEFDSMMQTFVDQMGAMDERLTALEP